VREHFTFYMDIFHVGVSAGLQKSKFLHRKTLYLGTSFFETTAAVLLHIFQSFLLLIVHCHLKGGNIQPG
jgi:putative Mn2+ efflux pump MntP